MKQRVLVTVIEVVGSAVACIGVAMLNVPIALIVAGTLVVVACEVNS